jgi:hypothetical protein
MACYGCKSDPSYKCDNLFSSQHQRFSLAIRQNRSVLERSNLHVGNLNDSVGGCDSDNNAHILKFIWRIMAPQWPNSDFSPPLREVSLRRQPRVPQNANGLGIPEAVRENRNQFLAKVTLLLWKQSGANQVTLSRPHPRTPR